MYLIKTLRRRLGGDYEIRHTETNTDKIETFEIFTETDPPNNHVGIQAHGFNLVDVEI